MKELLGDVVDRVNRMFSAKALLSEASSERKL